MSLDDVSTLLGKNRIWQWQTFFLCLLLWVPMSSHTMAIVFLTALPAHWWCVLPYDGHNDTGHDNGSATGQQCYREDQDGVTKCTHWEYDRSLYIETVATKFNLVCDQKWLISVSSLIFMLGLMVGLLIFGHLADKYGRKPITMAGLVVTMVAGVLAAFPFNFAYFMAIRFIVAMGAAGCSHIGFSYFSEVTSLSGRSGMVLVSGGGWAAGFMWVAGLAWWVRNWFTLQLTISLEIIILIVWWWFQIESPRWLITRGRTDEAIEAVTRVVSSKEAVVKGLDKQLQRIKGDGSSTEDAKDRNFTHLFRTPVMRKQTLVLIYLWMTIAFVYYGFTLRVTSLGGNVFMNFFISGAVELPLKLMTLAGFYYIGRRYTAMIGFGVVCSCCFLIPFMPKAPSWIVISLAVLGQAMDSATFSMLDLYTTELTPTVVRSIGLTTCSLLCRISSGLSPFLTDLGEATYESVPFILCGSMALIAILVIPILRETRNRPLPETILDVEQKKL